MSVNILSTAQMRFRRYLRITQHLIQCCIGIERKSVPMLTLQRDDDKRVDETRDCHIAKIVANGNVMLPAKGGAACLR